MPPLSLPAETCQRCRRRPWMIMSKFNLEMICHECKARERQHPKYPEADAAECAAVRAGNPNYPGIGCPPELYVFPKE